MRRVTYFLLEPEDLLGCTAMSDGEFILHAGDLDIKMGPGWLAAVRDACDRALAGRSGGIDPELAAYLERRAQERDAVEEGA